LVLNSLVQITLIGFHYYPKSLLLPNSILPALLRAFIIMKTTFFKLNTHEHNLLLLLYFKLDKIIASKKIYIYIVFCTYLCRQIYWCSLFLHVVKSYCLIFFLFLRIEFLKSISLSMFSTYFPTAFYSLSVNERDVFNLIKNPLYVMWHPSLTSFNILSLSLDIYDSFIMLHLALDFFEIILFEVFWDF
jgi:hypothetical protein